MQKLTAQALGGIFGHDGYWLSDRSCKHCAGRVTVSMQGAAKLSTFRVCCQTVFGIAILYFCKGTATAQVLLNDSGVAQLDRYVTAGVRWQSR